MSQHTRKKSTFSAENANPNCVWTHPGRCGAVCGNTKKAVKHDEIGEALSVCMAVQILTTIQESALMHFCWLSGN